MKNLKKKLLFPLFSAVFIAAAVWGFFYFRNRDERLIRALIGELETMTLKRPGKSNVLSLLDAATPERVFAEKVKLVSDVPKTDREFSLKELSQLLITMKKSFTSTGLDVEILDIQIERDGATIAGNGIFTASSSRHGKIREVRELKIECIKTGANWKITAIKAESVIKK